MAKYAVGLDISMEKMDACVSFIDDSQNVKVIATKVIKNSKSGFKDLDIWVQKHCKGNCGVIGMEATGVYYEECAYFLHEKGYDIVVVLPNYAKKYFQAMGFKSKNDKADAKALSKMFAERVFRLWKPKGRFFYKLRAMTRYRESLQTQKTALNNQLHALNHGIFVIKEVLQQIQKQISLIEKQVIALEKAILEHIKTNEEIAEKFQKITTIKGVGITTVATIIAETNGFELFENSRQLVSYSGYDAVENQSGKHYGKTKISKKGNSHIRRILFLPAFNAVRLKVPVFLSLYERTFDRHKIKMKSYTAVQKKLLVMIYTLWKKDEEFIENYKDGKYQNEEQDSSLVGLEQAC